WCEYLKHEGRRQLPETQQQRGLPNVAEVGAVLTMAFQEQGIAGVGIDAWIKARQRTQRTEQKMTVMNDAMRMTVRLGFKLMIGLRLIARTLSIGIALVLPGIEGRHQRQDGQQRQAKDRDAVTTQESPFLAGDARHDRHATCSAFPA